MKKKDKLAKEEAIVTEVPASEPKCFNKCLLRLVMIGGAFVVMYMGLQQYIDLRAKRCKAAYKNVHTEAEKRAFASDFINQPLAAKVGLELADQYYAKGNYEDASKFYELAMQGLIKNPLGARATLGKGVSLMKLQQFEKAEKIFQRLMSNPKAVGSLQAEAALQAMLLALQNKDEAAMSKYTQELEALPYSELTLERMRLLEISEKEQAASDKE